MVGTGNIWQDWDRENMAGLGHSKYGSVGKRKFERGWDTGNLEILPTLSISIGLRDEQ